ncbi:MAG: hypothetical protein ABL898_17890, partial [Hyphomicrobiaceae bacterium]
MQKPNDSVSKALDAAHLMQQNPEMFAKNMLRLMEESTKVAASMAEKSAATKIDPMSTAADAQSAAKLWSEIAQSWMNDPKKLVEMQTQLTGDFFKLWQQTSQRMLGQDAAEVTQPDKGDARFNDPDWTHNPYFAYWKQAYLLTSKWATDSLAQTDGLDERTRAKAEFYMK